MKIERTALYKIVNGFRSGILNGRESYLMCFAICAPLQSILDIYGYDTELIHGTVDGVPHLANHYWLELKDKRIIDPTADQVSTPAHPMPKVYIGPLPDWYRPDQTPGLHPK